MFGSTLKKDILYIEEENEWLCNTSLGIWYTVYKRTYYGGKQRIVERAQKDAGREG